MSQAPNTPFNLDSDPGTPIGQTPRNLLLSSHLGDVYNSARTPGTPQGRTPYGRGEISSPLYSNYDLLNATSPLAYPTTPLRSNALGSNNTPRTTYVRTPHLNTNFAGTPLGGIDTQDQQQQQRLSSTLDTQETDPSLSVRLIWGTTVNIQESMTSFRNFLNNFTLSHRKRKLNETINDGDDRPFYPLLLNHVSYIDEKKKQTIIECSKLMMYYHYYYFNDDLDT